MRHIGEMGEAVMPPATSITTQIPVSGQPRPRTGLDHLTPDIALSRPDLARFGLSSSSGVFEQDATLEVYGADMFQAIPPTGATDPSYVNPRILTALQRRIGLPPEPNHPRPVATPGVVRPFHMRDNSQPEARSSVIRRANVPQRPQDDPIPSIETNHHDGSAIAQTGRADAREVRTLPISSAPDSVPSVTRLRTPSEDPRTSWVSGMLSENATTGETPEAYHRNLQARIHGRDTVQQDLASHSRSRSAQAEGGPATSPGQPIVHTSAAQQDGHLVPTLQPGFNAGIALVTAPAPVPARDGRGRGRDVVEAEDESGGEDSHQMLLHVVEYRDRGQEETQAGPGQQPQQRSTSGMQDDRLGNE